MTYLWTLLKCICKIRCVTCLCMMVRIELRTTIHEKCLIIKNEKSQGIPHEKVPSILLSTANHMFRLLGGPSIWKFHDKKCPYTFLCFPLLVFWNVFPFTFLWSKIISGKPFGAKMRLCSCIQFHSSTDQNSGHNCHDYYESEHLMLPKIGSP